MPVEQKQLSVYDKRVQVCTLQRALLAGYHFAFGILKPLFFLNCKIFFEGVCTIETVINCYYSFQLKLSFQDCCYFSSLCTAGCSALLSGTFLLFSLENETPVGSVVMSFSLIVLCLVFMSSSWRAAQG